MKVSNIFKRRYKNLRRDVMGFKLDSPIGIRISRSLNGAKYVPLMDACSYSYTIINCVNVSETINNLKRVSRDTNIFAHLDKHTDYYFQDKKKDMLSSAALLYDFVDAFIISGFDELSDDVDNLLEIRRYSDEYRPIIMEMPNPVSADLVNEIIDYALISDIDGLLISNMKLMKYIHQKTHGTLTLIYQGVDNISDITDAIDNGASLVCLRPSGSPYFSLCKGSTLARKLGKLLL